MQMLHPHCGSIQQYIEELPDADRYRPSSCPLCQARRPLIAHGFYSRTIVDVALDGVIRVRRRFMLTRGESCLGLPQLLRDRSFADDTSVPE